jgi:hypothetical protein
LELSKNSLKEYANEAKRLGIIIKEEDINNSAKLIETYKTLKDSLRALSVSLTDTLQPALILAGRTLTDFIANNRQQLIDFATNVVARVTKVGVDLFELFSTGGKSANADATAKKIYSAFITASTSISEAYKISKAFFDFVNPILNSFAQSLGFASTQSLVLTAAVLKFTGVFNVILTAVPVAINAFRLLAATVAVLTGPFGAVIAAIVAVGAGIAILIDKTIGWEAAGQLIIKFFQDLIAFAPFALQGILDLLQEIATNIIATFMQLPDFIQQILGPDLIASFSQLFTDVIDLANAAIAEIITLFNDLVNSPFFAAMVAQFAALWASIKDIFAQLTPFAAQIIVGAFQFVISGVTNAIGQAIASIAGWLQSAASSIQSTFSGIIDSISARINSVMASINSAINAAKSIAAPVVNTAKSIGSDIANFFGFAGGGHVRGPGTGTSDSIIARLSNNEFVVQAQAVQKYGVGFLHSINNGLLNIKGFATGGLVNMSHSLAGMSGPSLSPATVSAGNNLSGRPLTLVLPNGKTVQTRGLDESVAKSLEKELRSSANAKATSLPEWY